MSLVLKDGSRVSGFYLGERNDTLWVQMRTLQQPFPFETLYEVRIGREFDPVKVAVPAMICGGYAGALLAYRVTDAPFGYVYFSGPEGILPTLLASFAVGWLGYQLGTAFAKMDAVFRFDGGGEKVEQERGRMRDFLRDRPQRDLFHFTIYGGSISGPRISAYETPASYSYGYYSYGVRENLFNVFRRLEFTYSLSPLLETGVGIVRLSQPEFSSYGYPSYTPEVSTSVSYHEKNDGAAFLVVGGIHPLSGILPPGLDWKIEAGIGIAHVDFQSDLTQSDYYYGPYSQVEHVIQRTERVDQWRPALMAATEIDLPLYEFLSVGLSAEYTLAIGTSLPAAPEINIPSTKTGTGCIGFLVGIHF